MITRTQSYFLEFPSTARLWVFMAERELTDTETQLIAQKAKAFMPKWKAHGKDIKAQAELIDNRFLVVAADESQTVASGCSIDALTHEVQQWEKELNLSFTNRMLVAYEIDQQIQTLPLAQFKQKVKSGEIPQKVKVYNNSVSELGAFWDSWKLPLNESWAGNL